MKLLHKEFTTLLLSRTRNRNMASEGTNRMTFMWRCSLHTPMWKLDGLESNETEASIFSKFQEMCRIAQLRTKVFLV
jgi:hypothetical protein